MAFEQFIDSLVALVFEDTNLVAEVFQQLLFFAALDRHRALILFSALSGEDLHIDDRSIYSGRAGQTRVAHISGFLAEDRSQQFFFSRQLSFAFRRDLADEYRAGLDLRADADDSRIIKVAKRRFRDVRNVTGDFFGAELGVA